MLIIAVNNFKSFDKWLDGRFLLPYFGEIITKSSDEGFTIDMMLSEISFRITLNLSTTVNDEYFATVKSYLAKLEQYYSDNKAYLKWCYESKECETVRTIWITI
jgi:hypothetical protein